MILKALLLLAAAFALFWTIKTKKIFPTIITLGMIVGVILTLFLSKTVENIGIYSYTFDSMNRVIQEFIRGEGLTTSTVNLTYTYY